jgi:lipopolysaccharide export system permease protein
LAFIDEFAGKGLDYEIIGKFLIYYSPKLIPISSCPYQFYLASIMTYGSFAENYEFAAMKSTGISLQKSIIILNYFSFIIRNRKFLFFKSYYSLMESLNIII